MLIGGGYKCENKACEMTVHRWIGHHGVEDCWAEALLTQCPHMRFRKGSYTFGDLSKAIKNDFESTIEEQVVKGIVQEQRKLGKTDQVCREGVGGARELESLWRRG